MMEEVEVLLWPLLTWQSFAAVVGLLLAIDTFYHCLLLGIVDVAVLPRSWVGRFPVEESSLFESRVKTWWTLFSYKLEVSALKSLHWREWIARVGTGGFII